MKEIKFGKYEGDGVISPTVSAVSGIRLGSSYVTVSLGDNRHFVRVKPSEANQVTDELKARWKKELTPKRKKAQPDNPEKAD